MSTYSSDPREREGEAVESIVEEAIGATTSEATDRRRGASTSSLPEWLPRSREAFALAALIAVVEALVIVIGGIALVF